MILLQGGIGKVPGKGMMIMNEIIVMLVLVYLIISKIKE